MDKVVIAALALAFIVSCQQTERPAARQVVAMAQESTIDVGSEFSPASVTLPQGQPIRLKFRRGNQPTCADEVVFTDLGIRKKLPKNETTLVELPAQSAARTLNFTCGMNMMKGSVVIQ